jgi:hypothetical protein
VGSVATLCNERLSWNSSAGGPTFDAPSLHKEHWVGSYNGPLQLLFGRV